MKPIALCAPLIFGLSLTSPVVGADDPLVLPIWPGKVPGDYGEIGSEHIRPPENAPTKDAKWLTNVTKPTITVFRPAKEKNTGAAMLICPGGGYWNLAWDLEGEEVAAWLNSVGMTGIVLKYRVPRRPGQPEPLPAPGPLLDSQRAVSLVRSRARECCPGNNNRYSRKRSYQTSSRNYVTSCGRPDRILIIGSRLPLIT